MYQNYIFDLYGTLVDIHTNERKPGLWKKFALVMTMQGAAYSPKELKKRYEELSACEDKEREILLDLVFKQLYVDKGMNLEHSQMKDIAIMFRALSLEKLRLFDGAEELLNRLHRDGKKVYLLSNAQRLFTEPEMKMLGIYDKFDGILYSSDIGYKKPSPLFYKALFAKYLLKKEDSVMIGNDSEADAGGAFRFGIDSMYVHTEQSPEMIKPLPDNCRRLHAIGEAY